MMKTKKERPGEVVSCLFGVARMITEREFAEPAMEPDAATTVVVRVSNITLVTEGRTVRIPVPGAMARAFAVTVGVLVGVGRL
ncbi:MAG: hypothetical protein PWP60_1440 [Candidatus Atribacteria bacterium]|jgi:hypothetical protein|nr:hypothetical protein [Candidatus Atribacteria bacterium]